MAEKRHDVSNRDQNKAAYDKVAKRQKKQDADDEAKVADRTSKFLNDVNKRKDNT